MYSHKVPDPDLGLVLLRSRIRLQGFLKNWIHNSVTQGLFFGLGDISKQAESLWENKDDFRLRRSPVSNL